MTVALITALCTTTVKIRLCLHCEIAHMFGHSSCHNGENRFSHCDKSIVTDVLTNRTFSVTIHEAVTNFKTGTKASKDFLHLRNPDILINSRVCFQLNYPINCEVLHLISKIVGK